MIKLLLLQIGTFSFNQIVHNYEVGNFIILVLIFGM